MSLYLAQPSTEWMRREGLFLLETIPYPLTVGVYTCSASARLKLRCQTGPQGVGLREREKKTFKLPHAILYSSEDRHGGLCFDKGTVSYVWIQIKIQSKLADMFFFFALEPLSALCTVCIFTPCLHFESCQATRPFWRQLKQLDMIPWRSYLNQPSKSKQITVSPSTVCINLIEIAVFYLCFSHWHYTSMTWCTDTWMTNLKDLFCSEISHSYSLPRQINLFCFQHPTVYNALCKAYDWLFSLASIASKQQSLESTHREYLIRLFQLQLICSAFLGLLSSDVAGCIFKNKTAE